MTLIFAKELSQINKRGGYTIILSICEKQNASQNHTNPFPSAKCNVTKYAFRNFLVQKLLNQKLHA